jgi:hypothetical protein
MDDTARPAFLTAAVFVFLAAAAAARLVPAQFYGDIQLKNRPAPRAFKTAELRLRSLQE